MPKDEKNQPFKTIADQLGFNFQLNQLSQVFEPGLECYYKRTFKEWISASIDLQGYYSSASEIVFVPSARIMVTY